MPYVHIDGVRVHYVEHGPTAPSAPTAVLIHGFPVDHRIMTGSFEEIFADRPGWRRIYLDLPGMGKTEAPDVAGTDDVFQILRGAVNAMVPSGTFTLVGQSYGGYLARGLVAHDPDRIDGLAILVPVIHPRHEDRDLPERRVLIREPALVKRVDAAALEAEDVLVVQNEQTWDRHRRFVDPGLAAADPAAVERIAADYVGTFPVEVAPFDRPALVIAGRQDSITGYRDAWTVLEHYPRATFAVLDRAGHGLEAEQPKILATLVTDWLDRVEHESRTRASSRPLPADLHGSLR